MNYFRNAQILLVGSLISWSGMAYAEELGAENPSAAPAPVQTAIPVSPVSPVGPVGNVKKSRGKRVSEKEAEGTKAPDRFEADTVIKSRYRLNGQALEVDPD